MKVPLLALKQQRTRLIVQARGCDGQGSKHRGGVALEAQMVLGQNSVEKILRLQS